MADPSRPLSIYRGEVLHIWVIIRLETITKQQEYIYVEWGRAWVEVIANALQTGASYRAGRLTSDPYWQLTAMVGAPNGHAPPTRPFILTVDLCDHLPDPYTTPRP